MHLHTYIYTVTSLSLKGVGRAHETNVFAMVETFALIRFSQKILPFQDFLQKRIYQQGF
jgi:uncharacterized membrane protein